MRRPTDQEWALIRERFDALAGLTADEQARQLNRSDDDAFVITEVQALLAAAATCGILDADVPPAADGYSSLLAGQKVGGFTIDRLIGRGGMGEVYAAHRTAVDFEQRVALKLLRPEAAGHDALFDRERRLLARLEHPGIARLIDGGLADDGRPFMAMEYVDGEPVDTWCRDRGADLPTRLGLVIAMGDAVSFAHANLVIHRDLKPSNILVDGSGRVRLLDFGIARLVDDAALTQMPMTPEYAAPEQLENAAPTIATDVYALGVVMFEMLAGRNPWGGAGSGGLPGVVRRVLASDPPLPSAVTTAMPAQLLIGDLDAIVMKAMRRAPADRYRSAADMADDIRRYLAGLPVLARAGGWSYSAARFVRRHRWAVGAATVALLAVLVGAAGIAWQARATRIERDVARAELRRSDAVNRMVSLMFRDARAAGGEAATVKQMLDDTAARLVASVDGSAQSATLIATIADLYIRLEDPLGAETLLDKALAAGIGKNDTAALAQLRLRAAMVKSTLGKLEAARALLPAAARVFDAAPQQFRAERLHVTATRARLARQAGDRDGAIALLLGSEAAANTVYADDHRELLVYYNNLLAFLAEANRTDAMLAVLARAEAAIARTGETQGVEALGILQLKGVYLSKRDDVVGAEAVFRQVVALRRQKFGPSAGLAVDLLQLGRAQLTLGQARSAVASLAEARALAAQHLGADAVPTLVAGMSLAEALAESGDQAAAQQVLATVESAVAATGQAGPYWGIYRRTRAVVRLRAGDKRGATADIDAAAVIFKSVGPVGTPYLKSLDKLRVRLAG